MGAARRHVPVDTGGVVGSYILGKRLGAGGMGVVYEATLDNGVPVAIKLPYCETLDDEYASRRFHDEGIAGAIVSHPNLARVVEHGATADGIPYLVMEHVDGERLSTRILHDGMVSLRAAAVLVRQLLDGLDALHAAGIVHADVKSDNVLIACVDGRDVAKLIDFGLAHPDLEGPRRHVAVDDELVSGTPDYMAPEVIRGEGSTASSDLYAAGVILYELITGSTPFSGGTAQEIVNRHLSEPVIPPSLRRPDREVPPILERIVLRALAKDPTQRYRSAAAFASALAVAIPSLPDEEPGMVPTTFSTDASTLDWKPRTFDAPRRRVARGTPPLRRALKMSRR